MLNTIASAYRIIIWLFSLLLSCSIYAQSPPTLLSFDFPDVQIGVGEYPEGPTGTTLFYFPKGATAAIDIRGGSVGTFFTQEKMQHGEAYIDGVVFSGGGILGLEAVSGVVSHLFTQKKKAAFTQMPLISGAVIYDYTPRKNQIFPDKKLGEIAFSNLKPGEFPLGRRGAGISATIGKLFEGHHPGGQGGAFAQWGETKVAVFTVLNAVGVILNDKGEVIHGLSQPHPIPMEEYIEKLTPKMLRKGPINLKGSSGNTTLTIVITNQKLAPRHLQQLGKTVHHALSQVISPYASNLDGDLVYTVSTGTVESDLYCPGANIETDMNLKLVYLGILAGELAKQAVWSAIP